MRVRNTTRRQIWLDVKAEAAARARLADVAGIHVDRDYLVIGESEAHPVEPQPEFKVPDWLWKAVLEFSDPQKALIDAWLKDGTIVKYAA